MILSRCNENQLLIVIAHIYTKKSMNIPLVTPQMKIFINVGIIKVDATKTCSDPLMMKCYVNQYFGSIPLGINTKILLK